MIDNIFQVKQQVAKIFATYVAKLFHKFLADLI